MVVGTKTKPPSKDQSLEVDLKLRRRFYEPIVLESALTETYIANIQGFSRVPNHEAEEFDDDAERAFHCFVYKLAHVCDSRRGGPTVSSIAVLKEADCIRYLVGSNERKERELENVRQHVIDILKLVGKSDFKDPDIPALQRKLLLMVLRFNLPRIKVYVKILAQLAERCIADCERQANAGNDADSLDAIKQHLETLLSMTSFHQDKALPEEQYLTGSLNLVRRIHRSQSSEIAEAIRQRTREGQAGRSGDWKDLRHFSGRLHAYHKSAGTIVRTRRRWEELFHEFEVTVVPSSDEAPNPLKNEANRRSRIFAVPTNASDAIGRMLTGTDEIERYRGYADELQKFDLDGEIQKICDKKSFRPIVHAEILVHHAALARIKDDSSGCTRFWNDWKYIGSSKPTCRLCGYYFEVHPERVAVRSSHRNLYIRWRVPEAKMVREKSQRDKILNDMNKKTRQDALRSLRDKTSQGKNHDSNSSSTVPVYLKKGDTNTATISDLTSQLGNLDFSDGAESGSETEQYTVPDHSDFDDSFGSEDVTATWEDESPASSVEETSPGRSPGRQRPSTVDVDSAGEDDDEGGGVLLYRGRS